MRILHGKVTSLESAPWKHADSGRPLIKTRFSFDTGVSLVILTQTEANLKLADAIVVAAYGLSQPYKVTSFKNASTGENWFQGGTLQIVAGVILAVCPWLFSLSEAVNTDLLVLKLLNYGFYAAALACFYAFLNSYLAFQKVKKFKPKTSSKSKE